jgi:hypothetical protein
MVTMSPPESGTGKVSLASRFSDASGSHKVVLAGRTQYRHFLAQAIAKPISLDLKVKP